MSKSIVVALKFRSLINKKGSKGTKKYLVFLIQSQRIASIWVIGFIMMHLDMIGEFLSNRRGRWEAFNFQPTAGIGKDRTKPFANRRGVTLEM